jgi:hypothetical protein
MVEYMGRGGMIYRVKSFRLTGVPFIGNKSQVFQAQVQISFGLNVVQIQNT